MILSLSWLWILIMVFKLAMVWDNDLQITNSWRLWWCYDTLENYLASLWKSINHLDVFGKRQLSLANVKFWKWDSLLTNYPSNCGLYSFHHNIKIMVFHTIFPIISWACVILIFTITPLSRIHHFKSSHWISANVELWDYALNLFPRFHILCFFRDHGCFSNYLMRTCPFMKTIDNLIRL